MVPAGIHWDLGDKTLCLTDEVRISLAGRRPPYRSNVSAVNLNDRHVSIMTGKSTEARIGINSPRSKLWVRQNVSWVPTVTSGPGKIMFLQLKNVGTHDTVLIYVALFVIWMSKNMVSRSSGYVLLESRR